MTVLTTYLLAIAIGLCLGIIGGGGSILTVPVLVYVAGLSVLSSTFYSLFIVGITAATGAFTYGRKELIHFRTALSFGIPSVASVLLTRAYLLPALPDPIITTGNMTLSKDIFILLIFAVLMVASAVSMIRMKPLPANARDLSTAGSPSLLWLSVQGLFTGVVTGLVGAGGGFLIVPALVFFARLPMKTAVGTSLFIIAVNALIGFFGDYHRQTVPWGFLLVFSAFAMGGMFIGARFAHSIDNRKLRPVFGWFVLVMGLYIILKEIADINALA